MKKNPIIDRRGNKRWYKGNRFKRHREDGPAIEFSDGDKSYYQNDLLHREDGPAIDWEDRKEWWYHGERIMVLTNKEFLRIIKLKSFW